ncbi:hypothetical protein K439DRAFT_551581 [Ramaria rubella]|nr:hypothetical protein K439DRAFT_551581 [Ramaria rubella]
MHWHALYGSTRVYIPAIFLPPYIKCELIPIFPIFPSFLPMLWTQVPDIPFFEDFQGPTLSAQGAAGAAKYLMRFGIILTLHCYNRGSINVHGEPSPRVLCTWCPSKCGSIDTFRCYLTSPWYTHLLYASLSFFPVCASDAP